ncbi:hypothetical protein P154DRAFT_573713 [Amniculicola lignicola CBS 123094]|uniref:Uncharacterized protein n=1 Tax=Amniculicola lignicola CBS 123094 TaxID=1392246 RepID=A0A6A5WV06_9PLEO|nr:hypothetical protein P154DRAFT_573713 [Amniculicola lignicola CBS 123094]
MGSSYCEAKQFPGNLRSASIPRSRGRNLGTGAEMKVKSQLLRDGSKGVFCIPRGPRCSAGPGTREKHIPPFRELSEGKSLARSFVCGAGRQKNAGERGGRGQRPPYEYHLAPADGEIP